MGASQQGQEKPDDQTVLPQGPQGSHGDRPGHHGKDESVYVKIELSSEAQINDRIAISWRNHIKVNEKVPVTFPVEVQFDPGSLLVT